MLAHGVEQISMFYPYSYSIGVEVALTGRRLRTGTWKGQTWIYRAILRVLLLATKAQATSVVTQRIAQAW